MKDTFLTEKEIADLVNDIKLAEDLSTGEIRIHIDSNEDKGSASKAFSIFKQLKMDDTKERNAVLFYVNFEQKYLTIIGDEAIHHKVSQKFWDNLHDRMTALFQKKEHYIALKMALQATGIELKKHFPTQGENPNELSNEISFS